MKQWIYSFDKRVFLQVDEERLDKLYQYNPAGKARYQARKNGSWEYVSYADTLEECVKKENSYQQAMIDNLKSQIARAESALLTGKEQAPKRKRGVSDVQG